jgi:hypothetical protein
MIKNKNPPGKQNRRYRNAADRLETQQKPTKGNPKRGSIGLGRCCFS